VIPGIKCLTILGETGRPSEEMAAKCAKRWWAEHRRVRLIAPNDDSPSDMNDVLLQGGDQWHVAVDHHPDQP
jgi:hypothetical protein